MTTSGKNIKVFVVYAPEDADLMQELQEHLSILKRQGMISVWSEANIAVGEDWALRKADLLAQSQLILLLISSDFLASDNLYNTAVVQAMTRHNSGEACVVPIVVRDCLWQTSAFANLVPLPKGGYPVTDLQHWRTRDAAFRNVAEGLTKVIDNFKLQSDGNYKFEKPITIEIPLYNQLKRHTPDYANIIAISLIVLLSLTAIWLYWKQKQDEVQTPPINPILKPIQGLWVNPNNHIVAKLLFSGDEVEVFSVDETQNYSWGIERVSIANSRKLTVDYADWDIQFSLLLEEKRSDNVQDTLWFLYKVDTTATPLTILNIPLVRPQIAAEAMKNGNKHTNTDTTQKPMDSVPNHRGANPYQKVESAVAMPVDTNTVSLRTLQISPKKLIKESQQVTPNNRTVPASSNIKKPSKTQTVRNTVKQTHSESVQDSAAYTITIPSISIDLSPIYQILSDTFQKRNNYKAVRDTSVSLINRYHLSKSK